MYQSHHQASNTEFSYYPVPSLAPSNSIPINPPPHFGSLSSDPSFSHLPPPTHVPYHNSSPYPSNVSGPEIQSAYYQDLNANWVVKEAAPIRYSPAIQPLNVEAIAPTNYFTSLTNIRPRVRENLVSNYPKRKLKRPKTKTIPKKLSAGQKVRCELCKIECTHIQLYEKHLSGKMHTKNLQKIYASGTTKSSVVQASNSVINKCSSGGHSTPGGQGIVPADLETKKQKLLEAGTAVQSLKVCTVCNVACNGEIAFADHLAGKKHMAQVRALCSTTNPNTVSASNPEPNSQEKIAKRKNDGSATVWCEVCKISCTSRDGLNVHRRGKKHKKNLEKLQNSVKDTNAPAPNAAPLPSKNPPTGAQENAESQKVKKKGVRSKETTEDVETKKRKVLECGAAADAVRTCAICNVVCNSDTVFKSHLTGQKHATMVKQAEAECDANYSCYMKKTLIAFVNLPPLDS